MPESFRSGVVVLVAGSFLLGCAAVVLGFSAGFWRIAVIVGLVAVVRTMHVWTVRRRVDRCGPEEFLREIGDRGEFTEAEILDARLQLAGILGVDQAFLDPREPIGEQVKKLDFLGSSFVGLDDLAAEVDEYERDRSIAPGRLADRTVGSIVMMLAGWKRERP
ncbi:MAG: hypothetical protein K8H77_12910 [Cutibacterium acnes]|nr:hypothetical protein [Cutibacterium acnes]